MKKNWPIIAGWTGIWIILGTIIVGGSTGMAIANDWPRWIYPHIYADAVGAVITLWIIGLIPLLFCPKDMLDSF